MLNSLQIRNLAVIDEVEVELGESMTALTGETGAGKSIFVDALGLALGNRADSSAVRKGARRAEIAASFSIGNRPRVSNWLEENDLDADDECQLRRVISAEGRSRAYVNGQSVTLQLLRELGDQLVDICGQQAHQSLLRTAVQREILDYHGQHGKLLDKVGQDFRRWETAAGRLGALEQAAADRDRRLDLLRYQVQELQALDLEPGETQRLTEARERLAHSEKIARGIVRALELLSEAEGQAADALLAEAEREIAPLSDLDPQLKEAVELIEQSQIQAGEAASQLRRYRDAMDADPGELQRLEDRLASVSDLARKHRVTPEELIQIHQDLQAELDELENAGQRLEDLRREVATREREMHEQMKRLTRGRKKAAGKLAKAITERMADLGMAGGSFGVNIAPADPGPEGADRIEFEVSTNPGLSPGPITKVASGGELSRIALAIQVVAAQGSDVPTLVFDEVDSGVGGGTAEVVGKLVAQLGKHHQVLCVTHLPQVASQADNHLFVIKISETDKTRTQIQTLDGKDRIEEIARMLGGVKITRRTREHAEEMLG